MDIVLVGSKVALGLPPLADFMIMGIFVGGSGASAVPAGILAHHLFGVFVGVVFVLSILYLSRSIGFFNPSSLGKAVMLGVLAGVVVYIVAFIPTLMLGFAPIMVGLMGEAAMAMMPIVLFLGFVEHILYGLSIGYFLGRSLM